VTGRSILESAAGRADRRRGRVRRIALGCALAGALSGAGPAPAQRAGISITDETLSPRDAVENVTCIPPLLGNRCLGISCLEGCDDPIDDIGNLLRTVLVPQHQFTAFGLESCSINRLNFALELTHQHVGDLRVKLEHDGTSVVLYQPPSPCAATAIDAVWSDQGLGPANACPASSSGTFLPHQPLAAFQGAQLLGFWHLTIEDQQPGASGQVERWRFAVDASCTLLGQQPACIPGENVLCLGDADRFEVRASWEDRHGATGTGRVVELTSDTGYFWFFDRDNVEIVVKVLQGCAITGHYWVFASGLTDVAVQLEVTDTRTGTTRTYVNPQRTAFEPIQDTSAFATCP
jgi:hypothetical protein